MDRNRINELKVALYDTKATLKFVAGSSTELELDSRGGALYDLFYDVASKIGASEAEEEKAISEVEQELLKRR